MVYNFLNNTLDVMWLSLTDDEYARDNMYFILVNELDDEV